MKLSVITVTYNNEKNIDGYLSSVLKKIPESSNVIIVDSGSTDGTVQKIKESKSQRVKVMECGENVGFGKGCNIGIKNSESEYLFFLNPDTQVLDDSINKLINSAGEFPDFGIIAPKLLEPGGVVQPSVRRLPTLSGAIAEYFLGRKNAYEAYAPKVEKPTEVEAVFGAAILIKREIFNKVGGFNARYFMFFEDLDLCRKIKRLGLPVIYDPRAEFIHEVGSSYNENKVKWSKESDRIYHGNLSYTILSMIYFLNRIKNRISK